MKIVIATDAWEPQVNGVVRTLKQTHDHLILLGHEVTLITPELFRTIPCPSYPSIPLALFPGRKVGKILDDLDANAIHIATEGPIGMAARSWCLRNGIKFTTSYHTQFPEYLRLRAPIPLSWSYAWLRRFHGKAERTLVPTRSQQERLYQHGFEQVAVWGRGVDTHIFSPEKPQNLNLPGPILLNMGRVAVEKNIEAFLDINVPGSKVVVGDGPDLTQLQQRYPDVLFTGAKFGKELASYVAAADVFVFPSKTDTFGLVLLEALACGVPVAAYPVTGPADIIENGVTGFLDEDLNKAVLAAQSLDKNQCIAFAKNNSWLTCTEVFAGLMHDNHPQTDKDDPAITNQAFWCL
ncbi:glycosyltransferase family 4 protein [Methylophaga sp. OBS4]|uniref:glycosyltransferase family 4 protein n=1 Tax=Methylophaga sp. OBS4 TaxID=2991935 RepID=UPI0022504CBD|nr:glycosyltransferase family 1 protein [Methylophaga sp. OBS4]MCX4187452.1 glycosyltransferase family 1 protein [Methylophaga sp. OBS4]